MSEPTGMDDLMKLYEAFCRECLDAPPPSYMLIHTDPENITNPYAKVIAKSLQAKGWRLERGDDGFYKLVGPRINEE